MMMATLTDSCNAAAMVGVVSHLSAERMEKKENPVLERYLSLNNVLHSIPEIQTVHTEGHSVMDRSWKMEDGWRTDLDSIGD
jgi:hypothetical protein